MTPDDYKKTMQEIAKKYHKMHRGAKYINHWDWYWLEKTHIADTVNLDGISTALDIGTGIGMLAHVLRNKGIDVEGTDIDEESTGPLFKECCDSIGLVRHYLKIEPQVPMQIGNYDLLIATRTEFDRQFSSEQDWTFFVDDAMKHCKRLFIKFNVTGKSAPPFAPESVKKYMWFARGLGKPRRAWYLQIDRDQWHDR